MACVVVVLKVKVRQKGSIFRLAAAWSIDKATLKCSVITRSASFRSVRAALEGSYYCILLWWSQNFWVSKINAWRRKSELPRNQKYSSPSCPMVQSVRKSRGKSQKQRFKASIAGGHFCFLLWQFWKPWVMFRNHRVEGKCELLGKQKRSSPPSCPVAQCVRERHGRSRKRSFQSIVSGLAMLNWCDRERVKFHIIVHSSTSPHSQIKHVFCVVLKLKQHFYMLL